MTDFFDRLYTRLSSGSRGWKRRAAVAYVANLLLPVYYRFGSAIRPRRFTGGNNDVILSLTSFPKRIGKVWITLESLARQKVKPGRVVLYLSADEFPEPESIPRSLRRLRKRGLTIELRPGNLRSHKKYFYAMTGHPRSTVITVDDDVFYNSRTVERLVECHRKFPGCVCANFATTVLTAPDGSVQPYEEWKTLLPQPGDPSYAALPIGIGGVLYPPGALHRAAFDPAAITATALHADDLWLKAASLLSGVETVRTDMRSAHLPVRVKGDTPLWHINMLDGGNDRYIKAIREHFLHLTGKDIIELSRPKAD